MTKVILKPNTHVRILDSAIELVSNQFEYKDNQNELFVATTSDWKGWNKKFLVKTQTATITPMGTKFSVKAKKNGASITVLEGSTRLESNDNSWVPVTVQQNEKSIIRGGKNYPEIQTLRDMERQAEVE